ncbi:MAG TPA: hypothetical protein VLI41_00210 [Phenylobacterium sp.]|uniref:hypothetical protein n=1 Tax=Phenylobacterium sp. TaxID=1871053 RepID=UPI002C1088B1|nr:hypothetical protein [Phenylobacterium sp.]HSV01599.1 hypothetical protein [Phenylobacterium sp.]
MSADKDKTTSSDLGGAPGGLGASTGADPRGPAAGERSPTGPRSFAPKEPGRTAPEGEGGGAMSGRGQEEEITEGPDASAPGDETSGTGDGATGGTGASASGDAHLGKDGRKLGDPMNAKRQVPSDPSRDLANGSGAD